MLVCPSCQAEFVDSAKSCNDCEVDLISPDQLESEQTYEDARTTLAKIESVRLSVGGGLAAARDPRPTNPAPPAAPEHELLVWATGAPNQAPDRRDPQPLAAWNGP